MRHLLEPGVELIPGYRLVRYLGRGGFGEVWETEAPGGISKALKCVAMDLTDEALESRELDGLQKIRTIRHPYLLSIERFEIVDGDLVIVMELADESLADRLENYQSAGRDGIPRDELLVYMSEAAEVLDIMNEKHELQHLDIKPENLFLSSGHVKVADFGLVQPSKSSMKQSAVAISPPYAPPELFDGRVEPTSDQYSLAVTYQELLTGTRPYVANDVRGLIFLHLRGKPNIDAVPISDRPILARAYSREPDKRFKSCTEFVEALKRAIVFGTPVVEPTEAELREKEITKRPVTQRPSARFVAQGPKGSRGSGAAPIASAPTGDEKSLRRQAMLENPPVGDDSELEAIFVAFLPLEIFAIKLRGFMDALGAKSIEGDNEHTLLCFPTRRWLGVLPSSHRGIFLLIETFCMELNSSNRLVHVTIWSTNPAIRGRDLGRRFHLLILTLKAFLMATDEPRRVRTDAQLRAEILD